MQVVMRGKGKYFFTRRIKVVSIGRLTAFYDVLVPMEYILSKPPHSAYIIVSFLYLQKGSTF